MPVKKTLDAKLRSIHADPFGARDFILADAKDADMAFGIGAPGIVRQGGNEVRIRTLAEFREQIRLIVKQGIVDIMLMSASTNDLLAVQERLVLFERFACHTTSRQERMRRATFIFLAEVEFTRLPRVPFRTASIDHIQCGHWTVPSKNGELAAILVCIPSRSTMT